LLSLPLVAGTTLATIPAGPAYVSVPADRTASWRARIPDDGRLRVGVTWSGNRSYRNDRHRSMPLRDFKPILDVEGARFFVLNPNLTADDSELLRGLPNVTVLAEELRDFADTAAAIEALDLVVSTDTSVPHLAGALNKEVWILLGFAPDWRWLLERNDSPWYPSAKLFRQSAIGDWSDLVTRARQALERRVESRR
jgi:hypothetical protein